MSFIKKYALIIALVCLIILFFVSRFTNILSVPIFTDEAIYVRWSQIASYDAAWRFISLTDGKQPMFVWIAMIFIKFIHDPLLAGRMVSVFAGFFSMVGLYFLANELFKNKKIGLFASLLYVIYPFALVYDRLALYDSLVAMFMIWSLYVEVLLVRYLRLDLALILGMVVGAGMLTKSSADFALILLPFSLLLFNYKQKDKKEKLLEWVIYAVIVVVIANIMYAILRLSPFYHIIDDKNYTFIYPLKEWLQHPFAYVFENIRGLLDWLITYSSIPLIVVIAGAFFVGKKYLKEKLLLFVWFIVPFLALAFFGRVLYPRFILFMTMPLLALGAFSFAQLLTKERLLGIKIFVFFVLMFMILGNDYYIISDFAKAPIPKADRGQFITGWPAGVGVKETVNFLKEKSKNEKIYVGTEGTFGLMPFALEMYFRDNPNVKIVGVWPMSELPPKEAIEASKTMPTYFVFYQPCVPCKGIGQAPPAWPVIQLMQFQKIEKNSYYTLYQLKPQ